MDRGAWRATVLAVLLTQKALIAYYLQGTYTLASQKKLKCL